MTDPSGSPPGEESEQLYETRIIQEAAEAAEILSTVDTTEDATEAPIVNYELFTQPPTPVYDEVAMDQIQAITTMAGDALAE
jgi:hypothetical protein